MIYWEIVEKKNLDGSMKDEFMMVCNNFRNDLMHANEYIVGRALRLIGRINLK
jgi:vesicle coat complex subunit